MKKMVLFVFFILLTAGAAVRGQSDTSLTSEKLDKESRELDKIVFDLNKKIAGVIKNYGLMDIKDLRILPYQTAYVKGDGFIEIEKHSFVRDEFTGEISGIKKNKMKIYTNGSNVSRIESRISDEDFYSDVKSYVEIIDPSPSTENCDDIRFIHVQEGLALLDREMSAIKNTTAFPVRNSLYTQFLIPHLTHFYNVVLSIAESYHKSMKDSDITMSDFLKSVGGY